MAESGWTRIGGYSYTSLELAEVPQWVQDQMASLSLSGAASEGEILRTKGQALPVPHRAPGAWCPHCGRIPTPTLHSTRDTVAGEHQKATPGHGRGGPSRQVSAGPGQGSEPLLSPGRRDRTRRARPGRRRSEIYEETGLTPVKAEFLFTRRGTVNEHQVIRVDVDGQGRVRLQRKEIDAYEWWDGRSNLPVNAHVRDILARLPERHAETGR